MTVKNGSNVFASIGGVRINGLTSNTTDLAADEIDITTKDSTLFKEFLQGEKSGVFSFEGMDDESDTTAFDALFDAWDTGTAVAWTQGEGINTVGKRLISASGIITALSQTSPKNAPGAYSCSVRLTGTISRSTSSATLAP